MSNTVKDVRTNNTIDELKLMDRGYGIWKDKKTGMYYMGKAKKLRRHSDYELPQYVITGPKFCEFKDIKQTGVFFRNWINNKGQRKILTKS